MRSHRLDTENWPLALILGPPQGGACDNNGGVSLQEASREETVSPCDNLLVGRLDDLVKSPPEDGTLRPMNPANRGKPQVNELVQQSKRVAAAGVPKAQRVKWREASPKNNPARPEGLD